MGTTRRKVYVVVEAAPDSGQPESVWSTRDLAEAEAQRRGTYPYPFDVQEFEVDPDA